MHVRKLQEKFGHNMHFMLHKSYFIVNFVLFRLLKCSSH